MKKDIKLRIWGRVIMLPYYAKYIFFGVLAVIAVVIGIIISYSESSEGAEVFSPVPVVSSSPEVTDAVPALPSPSPLSVKVYIVGSVKNPGIYEVASGSLVSDVLDAAGGFSSDADPEGINLVETIESNVMIKVPAKGEAGGIVAGASGGSGTDAGSSSGKININTADSAALCTIPGVGESTASKIIKYREANGRFNAIEDVMNISGIKEAKFESMRDYICVE